MDSNIGKKECKEANALSQEMRRNAAQLWARSIGQNIQGSETWELACL